MLQGVVPFTELNYQGSSKMLAVGTAAPRFVANNQDGQEVRLEDFLGQKSVVLYFFPKDNTPG